LLNLKKVKIKEYIEYIYTLNLKKREHPPPLCGTNLIKLI